MSDGISDANREGIACAMVEKGLFEIRTGCWALYDRVFGLPTEVVDDIRKALEPFGLHVVNSHGATTKAIATDRAREAIAFVPPHERKR